jgi:ribosome-associated toxin RatA of RatAB toxin-antitoxin module
MVMVQALLTTVAALAATVVFASTGDTPRIDVVENAGVFRVDASFTVAAPAQTVAKVLTDYERIPEFMPDVTTSQVLSRTDAGLVVEQEATAKFMMFSKRVHLVLDVAEDGNTIRFRDRCGKSFTTYEGAWILTETNGVTAVAYQLSAKPSFEVPGFVLKRLLKRDAGVMIDRLKAEITSRGDLRQ